MADSSGLFGFGRPRDESDMLERLRLGAWPLAVLAGVFAIYLRHFGSAGAPVVALLVCLAAWLWRAPSGSTLLAALLASGAVGVLAIWRFSQPWSFDVAASSYLTRDTIRMLPAVFAVGAVIRLGWLLHLWHRFPDLRPPGRS